MDLLNKTFARLSDWYRSSTPAARLAAGLLLAVCAASVALLCNQQLSGGETYLFGGEAIAASQLPAVAQALAAAGLTDYEMIDNRIRVPHAKQAVYMGALASAGALPNNFGDSLRKMLDRSSSPWIGKRQQEEMSKVALQDELTKIINSMPGIDSASVLYNVQTEQGLNPKKLITASVNVKPSGSQLLTARQVEMIRQVVGPPIGVDPQCIAIIDFNGATYPAASAGSGTDAEFDRSAKTKLDLERKYTERIRETLANVVSGAAVSVNVEWNQSLDDAETTARPAPVVASPKNNAAQTETAGGVNQPATIKSLIDTVVASTAPKNNPRRPADAPLTPKHIAVAIGVPSSDYEEIWRRRYAGAAVASDSHEVPRPTPGDLRQIEAEVCANIKQRVSQSLPSTNSTNQDPAWSVTVTTIPPVTIAAAAPPPAVDRTQAWLNEHGTTVGVGLVALVSLIGLRWVIRASSPAPANTMPLRLAEETRNDLEEERATGQETAGRFRSIHGPSLREELATIVHDDPDGAASVLRNWIGSSN